MKSCNSNISGGSGKSDTYGAQDKLPRLPIPTLEATLEKFPSVLEALQTPEQQAETKRVCREFLNGDGPKLQQALLDYDAFPGRGSYIEEFWNESYLTPDSSVVMNLNPFFVLEEGPDPKIAKNQLRRAASLTFAAVNMASLLKDDALTPDVFKGNPLCMDQFKVLFGSSRQPSESNMDEVHVYPDSSHSTCWMIVSEFSQCPCFAHPLDNQQSLSSATINSTTSPSSGRIRDTWRSMRRTFWTF